MYLVIVELMYQFLSMNGRDLQSIYMESGNGEGNEDRYEFVFDQAKFTDNLILLVPNLILGFISKPGGFGDFYELYLQDEFTITFPMMPEVVYPIPETDFEPVMEIGSLLTQPVDLVLLQKMFKQMA